MHPIGTLIFICFALLAGIRLPAGDVSSLPAPAPTVTRPKPTTEALFSNLVVRLAWVKAHPPANQYTYTRTRSSEELDEKGKVKESQEKTQHFLPIKGYPFARVVSVNGKPLTGKELMAEQEREIKARHAAAAGVRPVIATEPPPKKEYALTADMFERFNFTLTGLEKVNGRDTWALTFAPRSKDLPVKQFKDRVINKLAGKLWIDAEEYELVRTELGLTESVSLVGGIVGTLRKFDYSLGRVRAEGGAWFTARSELVIQGREVVRNRHLRFRTEEKNFQKVRSGEAPLTPGAEQ